jgi:hypothetical protein
MAQSTISDVARAVLAFDEEQGLLEAQQLALCAEQYKIHLRLEAIKEARETLWRNSHGNRTYSRPINSACHT